MIANHHAGNRRKLGWWTAGLVTGVALVAVIVVIFSTSGQGTAPSGGGGASGGNLPRVAPNPDAIARITVSGDRIMRNGQPWWFLGYNSYTWSGNCGNDDERMSPAQVDSWFASMRHDGHGAVRLFFYRNWNTQRLDQAVASARKYGVYLILTLDDALGDCGTQKKDAGWFADQGHRDNYRAHMVDMLQRYKGDPTFAWFEYFNEPSDADGALRPFYDEMGATARQVDPTRLFSSGTVAPYATGGADNFRNISASPGVDIASLHEYDENEDESHHGGEVKADDDGKPVIVGEFGIKAGQECDTTFDDRAARFQAKTRAYLSNGYAGALAWSWQPGGDKDCEYQNLDEDTPSQNVLRQGAPD